VLIFPYKSQVEEDNSDLGPQNQIIGVLEKNNILYIDLYDAMKQVFEQDTSRSPLFHDWVHPNAKGTEVIVDSLINFLGY
jgi:lysophospholipase L1-like esterase